MDDLRLICMELEEYLKNGFFRDDGMFVLLVKKQYVAQVKDLRIEVFTRDHLPPHFHVINPSRQINAKFSIPYIEYLGDAKGAKGISEKDKKIIKEFFIKNPKRLELLISLGDKVFKDMKH